MAATACQEGFRELMDAVFKDGATPEAKEIFLFSDNEAITKDTVNANLTEITTNGGEKQTLTAGTWDAATDADPVVSRYNGATGVVFSFTGALTVYGYAIRGVTSTKLYGAENFGVQTYANGQSLTIAPLDIKIDLTP